MIVLDTHIWHWWINQIPGKLSSSTIALIEEADVVRVSAISCFEIAWQNLSRLRRVEIFISIFMAKEAQSDNGRAPTAARNTTAMSMRP